MKKTIFKKWFSFQEVANRLTAISEDAVSLEDVFDFVMNGELDVYIYLVTLPSVEVYPVSRMYDLRKSLFKNQEHIDKINNKELYPFVISLGYERQTEKTETIYGKYKIINPVEEGKTSQFLKANIACLRNKIPSHYDSAFEETLIIDNEGKYYQVLENIFGKYIEQASQYLHRLTFFEIEDFYVHIDDLLKFENPETIKVKVSPKEENTNLKIIGAMVQTILKRGEKRKNSLYSSQNELIAEILETYPNINGLSKTTLENRFSLANKTLEQDN